MMERSIPQRDLPPIATWQRPLSDLGSDGVIALVALLIAHDPFLTRLLPFQADENLVLGYWTLLAVWLGFRLSWRFGSRWMRWSVRHLWPMLLVLLVAFASTLWSLDPPQTLHRAVWLAESTLLGLFIGYRWEPRILMVFFLWYFVILLVGTTVIETFDPNSTFIGWGSDFRQGYWDGLLFKNTLAFVVSLAIAFALIGGIYGRLQPVVAALLLLGAAFVLLNTRSASGVVLSTVATSLTLLLWIGKRFRASAVIAVLVMVIAPFLIVAVIVNLDDTTSWVGRDITMSNRTRVWVDALQVMAEGPLIGFGLEAVWGELDATWFPHLATTKEMYHPHNGYLDVANGLGVPTALFATLYLTYIQVKTLNTYITTRSASVLFSLMVLNLFLLYNVVEATLFRFRRVEWIVCVVVIASVTRALTDRYDVGNDHASTEPAR